MVLSKMQPGDFGSICSSASCSLPSLLCPCCREGSSIPPFSEYNYLSAFLFSLWVSLYSSYHFYILKASQAEAHAIDLNLIYVTSPWPVIERKKKLKLAGLVNF